MKRKYESPRFEMLAFKTEKVMEGGPIMSDVNAEALDNIFDYCDHVGE